MTTTDLPAVREEAPAAATPTGRMPGRFGRLWLGRAEDPRWVRPALWVLLIGTAVLYLWNISVSGWANTFYSAAAQAGTESWKAMFFGSSDAANFITVDKTPAFLWVIEIFTRIFGLHYWTVLAPQALEGVAAVGLLYATVRRWSGPVAGLIAGAVLALTPVATLMFRFNNPDALLVLLLIAAVWATQRALEVASTRAGTRFLMLAGVFVGFGFLTKMLQALLIVPVLGLVYLVVADTPVRRRIFQLAAALGALIVSAGWWVLIVEFWPAGSRPYIGGSQNNSIFDLMFGYNGFGRLTGNETGSVVPGGATGAGSWGATGITRLFGSEMGTQASWLIPAALILVIAAIAFVGKAARTDMIRASALLWGGWLVVTGLTFSFGQGIIHPYYTVALAPAIGACVGIGAVEVWKRKGEDAGRAVLAVAMGATAIWAFELLGRSTWQPWLRWAVLIVGLVAAVGLAFTPRLARRIAVGMAALAVVVGLAAPAAYAVQTAGQAHTGAIPSAGPAGGGGGFGGGNFGGGGNFQRGTGTGNGTGQTRGGFGQQNGTGNGTGQTPGGFGQQNGTGTAPGGTTGNGTTPGGTTGTTPGGTTGNGGTRTGGQRGGGNLLEGSTPSAALTKLLKTNADSYTWVAAAITSNGASGYQLATGKPVMAIGGYNGTDPTPTLAAFEAYVKAGKIHYFIASGGGMFGSTSTTGTSSQITAWVEKNFKSTTAGGVTLYDLTTTNSGTTTS
jgi:4-amino-4-deoxy-L-arabinose transferase-like glycosyltransferase